MKLADKTILITGASQGIGRYLSIYLSQKCTKVIGLARKAEGLTETGRLVREAGGRFEYYATDLTQVASIKEAVEEIESKGETIGVLVNNAADLTSKAFAETTLDEIAGLVQTNVTGALQLTRLLLPNLRERQEAAIVNISSLAGYKPDPAQTVYSITKAAVNAMSQALRAELRHTQVHVINVAVSSVGTMDKTQPGQIPVALFGHALERALEREKDDLFLSPKSKWLMRLYTLYPPLAHFR